MHNEACCSICFACKSSLICPQCFEKCFCELRDLRAQRGRRAQLAEELEAAISAQVQCSQSLRNEQWQSYSPPSESTQEHLSGAGKSTEPAHEFSSPRRITGSCESSDSCSEKPSRRR